MLNDIRKYRFRNISYLFFLVLALNLVLCSAGSSRSKGALGSGGGGKAATGGSRSSYRTHRRGRNQNYNGFGSCMDQDFSDNSSKSRSSRERSLKRDLLCGYDQTSRPVYNDSTATEVHVAVALFHILDTDEKHQTFSVLMSVRLRWIDEYLSWDPDEYNGINRVHIPSNMIWTPDIVIANNADDNIKGYMNTYAITEPNGKVLWMFPALIKVTCTLDVRHFPFDRQHCDITFISWTYNGFEVDINHNATLDDNIIYYNHDNQEWTVTSISANKNVKVYACCTEPYPDVTITIHIKRRSLFYIFNLIFPCLLMYLASFLGFFLPTESGEKVNLELTILLALVVFLLIIGESLPPTPDAIPLLGILFSVTMMMVLLALVMGVIVTNLHVRKYTSSGIPSILKIYLIRFHCKYHHSRRREADMSKRVIGGSYTGRSAYVSMNSQGARFMRIIRKTLSDSQDENILATPNRVLGTNSRMSQTPLDRAAPGTMGGRQGSLTHSTPSEVPTIRINSKTKRDNNGVCTHHGGFKSNSINNNNVPQDPGGRQCFRIPSHLSLDDYQTDWELESDLEDVCRQKPSRRASETMNRPNSQNSGSLSSNLANLNSTEPSGQKEPHQRKKEMKRTKRRKSEPISCICNNPESWVLIARCVDRIFFWVFLASSILFLTWVIREVPD